MSGAPKVIVENGLSAGVSLEPAHDSVNLIGRAPDAALCLAADETSVSRRHCVLDVAGGVVTVKNLVDADRTRLNGEPVVGSAIMRPGDRLHLGSVALRLFEPSSASADDENAELSLSDEDVESVAEGPAHLGRELGRFAVGEAVVVETAHASDAKPVARTMGCDVCGRRDARPVDPDYADAAWLCAECAATRCAAVPKKIRVGPYEIIQKIGEGGMGSVYEGIDVNASIRVAVKVLRTDRKPTEKDVQRFLREQGIALTLHHPNVVRTFQVGAQNGLFFLASEFVRGGDATRLIGTANVSDLLRVGADLFRALSYAHSQGIVHRDVKPANILLTATESRPDRRAKLMDFGLAKNIKDMNNRMLTAKGEAGGTLSLMAPEQLLNFAGASWPADLYSGAATVFRLLTGSDAIVLPPGELAMQQVAAAVMSSARRPLQSVRPDLPGTLCAYLDGLLTKDDTIRSQLDAAQIAAVLEDWSRKLASTSASAS